MPQLTQASWSVSTASIPTFISFSPLHSGCDHLVIKENFYSTPRLICGKSAKTAHDPRTQENYRSVGRTLTISFSFSRNYEYAFLLEFASVGKFHSAILSGIAIDTF